MHSRVLQVDSATAVPLVLTLSVLCCAALGLGDDGGNALLREEEYDCARYFGSAPFEILDPAVGHANMGCVGSRAVKGVDSKPSGPFTSQ